jgi:uncharacterized protein (TIGR02466 family)
MSEIFPLFSTPVYVTTPDVPSQKFQKVLNYCKELEYYRNAGQNWASNNRDVLSEPMFAEIKDLIQKEIDYYTKNVMMWDSNEFYITQSWVNVNPKDTEHHIHYHYNSIISGTFYLETGDNDNIVFHRKSELSLLTMKRSSFNIWNSDLWKVQVKNNTIVLFPSSLYHSVDKNESDYERVSIAFNVFARGEFGSEEGLTYLKL